MLLANEFLIITIRINPKQYFVGCFTMADLDSEITDQDDAIRAACLRKDVAALKKYAIVGGGLKNDSLRKMAWPILCNVSNSVDELSADKEFFSTLEDKFVFADHPDWPVIVADIHRTVMWFDDIDDHEEMKAKLTQVIMGILLDDHELCYFQVSLILIL